MLAWKHQLFNSLSALCWWLQRWFKNTRAFPLSTTVTHFSFFRIHSSYTKHKGRTYGFVGAKVRSPHPKARIVLSKLEANYKLLQYFIWSKYFQQKLETTEVIIHLRKKTMKERCYTVLQFCQRPNHTPAHSRNCVSYGQSINGFALNWPKVLKSCFWNHF